MANIINMFGPLAFVLACLILPIPLTESLLRYIPSDPLALAPTIDLKVEPIHRSIADTSGEPVVTLPPNDPDFPGFSTSQEVNAFLAQCERTAGFNINCALDFQEAVFGKSLEKPTNECCHIITKQGRHCYDFQVRFILRFDGVHYNRKNILTRSEIVWRHCRRV